MLQLLLLKEDMLVSMKIGDNKRFDDLREIVSHLSSDVATETGRVGEDLVAYDPKRPIKEQQDKVYFPRLLT